MIYKYIECHGQTHGSVSFDQGFSAMPETQFLTKSASSTVPMTEDMKAFWEAYPKKMPDRFLYFRVNILGSGEYWGCFPEGNYAITSDGIIKDVSEMAVGDNYISHKNRPNVTKEIFAREHDGEIVTLNVTGIPDISCTPNHQFRVIPREQLICKKDKYKRCTPDTFHSCPRCGKCDSGYLDLVPQWIKAEKLRNGDMLLVPRHRPKRHSDPIHIDYARLIGLYLAEGSITKSDKGIISGLELDFHEEETHLRDDVTDIADRLGVSWGVCPQSEGRSIRVMLFSKMLGERMHEWCGEYSDKKTIAPSVFTQRNEFIKDLIGGYLDGDGHVARNGCATIRSCSKKLLLQVKQLLFRLGANSSWHWEDDPKDREDGKNTSPFGQIALRYTDLHLLRGHSFKADECTWEPKTKSDSKSFAWGDFYCIPVRKRTSEHRKCTVYNSEVGYDHSYIVNGVSVHNSNLNGDYFPESVLKQYHKTFHHARLYLHHQNKDPKKSHGRVIFSIYNDAPYAKRVEVIVAIDRKDPRIQDIIRKIERGDRIEVSMGTRVPYDICSICGNKASTRKQYCHHLKREMNKLYPDGRRVMAINPDPVFFDVSIVTIPADPSSGGMEKIAHNKLSSALLGEIYNMRSKYADYKKKEATIEKPDDKKQEKFIPEDVKGKKEDLQELGAEIGRDDNDMSEHTLKQISNFPLSQIFATLGGLKIPLRPAEYTCIIISKMASFPAAKDAYREGAEFAPAPPSSGTTFDIMSDFNPKLAHVVRSLMGKRSMYPHFVNNREHRHIKTARRIQTDYPKAAAFYAAYVRDITNLDQTKVAAILTRYSDIRDKVTGVLEDTIFHKTASVHDIVRDSYIGQELLRGAYKK